MAIHYGTVISTDNVSDVGEVRERIAADKDVLRIEMGSADMLLSEVDCVPIRGISLFAGNHGYENWMITVCLLCRCCARKSSVSLHEPT